MNNQRETFSISKRCIDLQKERNDRKTEFSKFFSKNVKTCIYNNHKIDKRDVATMLGFSYEMFRKKVGGQKPISKRDLVVAICMVLKLDEDQTNAALRMHGMLELQTAAREFEEDQTRIDQRDSILAGFLNGRFTSINAVNSILTQNELTILDLNDSRRHSSQHVQNPQFRIAHKEVSCDADYLLYYPDRSLEAQYSPDHYKITARMWIENVESQERFRLELDNYRSIIQQFSDGRYSWPPQKYDGNERFRNCFIDLQNMIDAEMRRMMAILNDTKNYKARSSAKLINGEMHIFHESYNYAVPEWNEYFWMDYCNGVYSFSVQKKSIFLWKYLGSEAYKKYVGNPPEQNLEAFSSAAQIEILLKNNHRDLASTEQVKLRVQLRAFSQAKSEIEDILQRLRSKEIFIRNIADQCPTPTAPFWYFNALELFDCTWPEDDSYDITPGRQSVEFPLKNNRLVPITADDVLRGYELGFGSIYEIAESIDKNGTLENIIK